MKLETPEATNKAWDLVKLMEVDYGDKLVVSLLKTELISSAERVDVGEYYNGKLTADTEICAYPDSALAHDSNNRAQ